MFHAVKFYNPHTKKIYSGFFYQMKSCQHAVVWFKVLRWLKYKWRGLKLWLTEKLIRECPISIPQKGGRGGGAIYPWKHKVKGSPSHTHNERIFSLRNFQAIQKSIKRVKPDLSLHSKSPYQKLTDSFDKLDSAFQVDISWVTRGYKPLPMT